MSLVTPLLWSFLPSQLAHFSLPYLTNLLPSIFPPAPRGSPTYIRNYKLSFTLIITTWLAYTFINDISSGQGNWYALLGVVRDVDDDGLKRAYRGLSRLHHPDRAGSNGDETFIRIRQAYEVLSDPVRRYAYDRFGPQILSWKAASVKEYIHTGLPHALGFYLVSGGIMLVLSLLGRAKHGAYWRYTLFILLLYSELKLILSPTSPTSPSFPFLSYMSRLPQFRRIELLHKAFTTLSVAITQLAGVWSNEDQDDKPQTEEEWQRLMMSLRNLEAEAVAGFQNEIAPLLSSASSRQEAKSMEIQIQNEMENILIERTLSHHRHIRPTWLAITSQNNIPPAPYPLSRSDNPHSEMKVGLEVARNIPLPPSPPPSPRLLPTTRQRRNILTR